MMRADEIAELNDLVEQEFQLFRVRLSKKVRDFIEERDVELENHFGIDIDTAHKQE